MSDRHSYCDDGDFHARTWFGALGVEVVPDRCVP